MDSTRPSFIEVITCPICAGRIEPLDTGISVLARIDAEARDIGGLKAYRCQQNAHIFFLKTQDVEIFDTCETASSR